ncbi:hypothetical protein [Streptomyces sp. NPDC085932]|uniref:hypothetical protein n=1 Tax=Streptomyces sp. NPDC085932 TaxID=3365741 RepID=UPI0037D225C3
MKTLRLERIKVDHLRRFQILKFGGIPVTPEQELRGLISDWRKQVDQLPIWSTGEERLHALMSQALSVKASFARNRVDFPEFSWEMLLDFLISWHFKHPIGSEPCYEDDVSNAVKAAVEATRLESLDAALRAQAYRVRKTGGTKFRVSYKWNMGLEVADLYLERQAVPGNREEPTQKEVEWASKQSRARLNAFLPPDDVISSAMERTRRAVQAWRAVHQDPPLSDDTDLGDGLNVGIMAEVLAALMAMAELGEMAHSSARVRGTTLQHSTEEAIVEWLARLCGSVPRELAIQAIHRLMAGPGKSMRTAILIPNGGLITVLPLVMFPRAIDAIVLRTAASDPARYGPIGKRQGERAKAWGRWLREIPGVKVTEGTKVRNLKGQAVGDLDVVAFDPVSRKGLILEIKWPIDALTLSETSKTDQTIVLASAQLGKVRSSLVAGDVQAKLPPDWPAFDEIDWAWGVGMPQQLTPRPMPEPDMFATSFRYVSNLSPVNSLTELITMLKNPIVPELNRHYQIRSVTIPLQGRYSVRVERLECQEIDWSPVVDAKSG